MRRITLITNPDKCNLRCPLCFLNQRGRPFGMGEMPLEVATAAIEKALCESETSVSGCTRLQEVIPSTMGEPLLYSKFDELLEFCKVRDIPMNLTTNGSFPGKWKTEAGMSQLLLACSDIKVSGMGWGEMFAEMMPGLEFDTWKSNVERLVQLRQQLFQRQQLLHQSPMLPPLPRVATVSLQVTLHKKNVAFVEPLLDWAKSIGIDRVKLNTAVFLSCASHLLRDAYALPETEVVALREKIAAMRQKLAPLRLEGSLFFAPLGETVPRSVKSSQNCSVKSQQNCSVESRQNRSKCRFKEELWILPDGSVEYCPNPERRFGVTTSAGALCENCPMRIFY